MEIVSPEVFLQSIVGCVAGRLVLCGMWRGSGEGKGLLFMSSRKGPQLEVVKASCRELLQGRQYIGEARRM